MSLNLQNKYPGRFDPVSADYPQGKFKNRSSPTAQDGSYMEQDWLNDWNGFFGALLKNANVTPNGSVDTATASQLYSALIGGIVKTAGLRDVGTGLNQIPDMGSFGGGNVVGAGYAKIPIGDGKFFHVRYGRIAGAASQDVNTLFITPFPTTCVACVVGNNYTPGSGGIGYTSSNATATGLTARGSGDYDAFYIAVGY